MECPSQKDAAAPPDSISGPPPRWNPIPKGPTTGTRPFIPRRTLRASSLSDEARANPLRESGFGTVLSHVKDGIARGTGVVVTLTDEKDNFAIVKEKASAHYSLSKGTSTQSYPSSLMGSIALLRQTYIDGQWYKTMPAHEGANLSLQAWNDQQSLPQIFEGDDKWGDLHGDRIGDEFGVQYIIKAGENEYQRIADIAATKAAFIVPVNFPQAMDVEDPDNARFVSLADMKHWELAPTNPGAFEKAGITFCLTTADLKDPNNSCPMSARPLITASPKQRPSMPSRKRPPPWSVSMIRSAASTQANWPTSSSPPVPSLMKRPASWRTGSAAKSSP
jgi:hypothetical protein